MVRDQVFAPRRVSRIAPGRLLLAMSQDVGNDFTGGFPGVSRAGNKNYAQWSETAFSALSRRI